MREMHKNAFKMKKISNTYINKVNWRFNQKFLLVTNRDFYCMVTVPEEYSGGKWENVFHCVMNVLRIGENKIKNTEPAGWYDYRN